MGVAAMIGKLSVGAVFLLFLFPGQMRWDGRVEVLLPSSLS